jgi:hypothetical protein
MFLASRCLWRWMSFCQPENLGGSGAKEPGGSSLRRMFWKGPSDGVAPMWPPSLSIVFLSYATVSIRVRTLQCSVKKRICCTSSVAQRASRNCTLSTRGTFRQLLAVLGVLVACVENFEHLKVIHLLANLIAQCLVSVCCLCRMWILLLSCF